MKRAMLCVLAGLAVGALVTDGAAAETQPPYPDVVDASHASAKVKAFFQSFFTAKSRHQPAELMKHFSEKQVTYIDATLGWPFYTFKDLKGVFETFMPKWPATGKSYPTRILGDTNSALVAFTDTPELFGGEIRILAAIDFKGGKVVRWIDYWDARNFGAATAAKMRTPADKFPTEFSDKTVGEHASKRIQSVAQNLAAALSGNDAARAGALFAYDAVYEDMALRAQIQGQAAITRYLTRAAGKLPYGAGASLRHVVGSDQGGGYEWVAAPAFGATVRHGVTALVLDRDGRIARLTTVWDGAMIGDTELQALVLLAVDK
jgi:ketosteroid isomerase-like protein